MRDSDPRRSFSSTNEHNDTASLVPDGHFLSLPPEIRVLIYKDIFAPLTTLTWHETPKPTSIQRFFERFRRAQPPPPPTAISDALTLFCSCRTIHLETSPLVYPARHFRLPCLDNSTLPPPFGNRTFRANVGFLSVATFLKIEDIAKRQKDCEFGDSHLETARLCPSLVRFEVYLATEEEVRWAEQFMGFKRYLDARDERLGDEERKRPGWYLCCGFILVIAIGITTEDGFKASIGYVLVAA